MHDNRIEILIQIQWNISCKATLFAPEMWPFKRVGLSSGIEISTFMFKFTLTSVLSRGVGLSSGWPLKTIFTIQLFKPGGEAEGCIQHTNYELYQLKFTTEYMLFTDVHPICTNFVIIWHGFDDLYW